MYSLTREGGRTPGVLLPRGGSIDPLLSLSVGVLVREEEESLLHLFDSFRFSVLPLSQED